MGALLTPSKPFEHDDLIGSRLKQGAKSAATFAAMSGTAFALNNAIPHKIGREFMPQNARRSLIGAASGAIGGYTDIELETGGAASLNEIGSSTLGFALFGAIKDGAGRAIRKLPSSQEQPLYLQPKLLRGLTDHPVGGWQGSKLLEHQRRILSPSITRRTDLDMSK